MFFPFLPRPPRSGYGLASKLIMAALAFEAGSGALQAQSIVQEYYVPMPEAQIRQAFQLLAPETGATMETVVSMVVGTSGTKVVYDHWEDGYEVNINAPAQATTQVWGDGNNANGKPPGFANDPASLSAGAVIALRNLLTLPRNPGTILYDGRDRVGATKGIVMSRAAWATNPGSVLADATEVSATIDWGSSFVVPVGENEIFPSPASNSMFEVTSLFVQAAQNGTVVQIDKDANGVVETTVTLNQGENYFLNRGVLKGATVTSSKPVQVHLMTGDIGANYEARWFSIPPLDQWGASYYSPVGTASDGDDTYIFLYNPDAAAITVNYDTRVSSSSFSVPGKGTYRFLMPQNSGAHFYNGVGKPFFAVGTVGAEPTANNVHDWGFSLVPEGNLTTAVVVGWGPGSSDLSSNGSPVWVTTTGATRLYVDYNGDKLGALTDPDGGKYDVHYDVSALTVSRFYDPDKDQTGMRVYTLDGTLLTAAWGQDPATAGPGNPFLDMGTTVPAFPVPVIQKSASVVTDLNTPGPSIGDTLEYTITMDNQSLVALGNVLVLDGLPPQLSYQAGTTTRDGVAVADHADPSTLFPLDESGIIVPILPRGQSTVIRYRTTIIGAGEIINNVGTSYIGVKASSNVPVATGGTACINEFTTSTGTPVSAYAAGAGIYVTLNEPDLNVDSGVAETVSVLVRNTTNSDYEFVTLTETGANTHLFRNTAALPSSTTQGLAAEDGTLNAAPGNSLTTEYLDPVHGEACPANAVIAVPSLTKQLYLSTDGADGDFAGHLDRVDPVATADASTSSTGTMAVPLTNVSLDATTSSSTNSATSLTFSHTVGSNANRLLLVGVSVGATTQQGNPPTVTGVTYGGTGMTLVGSRVSGTGGTNDDGITYIYRLLNPASGAANVVVTASGTGVIIAGASSFSNVHQTTPLGTYASNAGTSGTGTVTLSSASTEIVFSTIAWDEAPTVTAAGTQTSRWNITSSNPLTGAGSTSVGAASVTHTYTGSDATQDWSVSAVAVKPAPASGTAAATFTQTPVMAENLTLPAGSLVGAEAWFTTVSGTMPASPNITAVLRYGGTTFATSTGASSDGSRLTFTFPALAGNVTIPAGQAVSATITTAQSGVSFTLDYDSAARPSKITLPTNTVIHADSIGVYDAAYPGGSLVSTPTNGQILYVRTVVGDPFGAYDITSLPLVIDGPGTADDVATTLGAGQVVNTTTATKTYEYVWQTGSTSGAYTIAATAKEGFENTITSEKSTSVTLSYLDLGTPSVTAFSKDTYSPNENICVSVTDLDQNTNAAVVETVPAIVSSSTGDQELVVLTETGVNTGIFSLCLTASTSVAGTSNNGTLYAPQGSALQVNYIDPDDATDTSSDTATVPLPAGTPGVTLAKTLVTPTDGQAMVGGAVQFRLRVINTGSTTLSSVSVTDTYPAANLSYVSASSTPNTAVSGSLAWTNVGPLTAGQSVEILVNFTALASGNPAVNSAMANAGGGVTSTSNASVVITNPKVLVTKTLVSPSPGPANKGDNVVFSIQVENTGDTAISSLPVEDVFSGASFEFVSATPAPDATGSGSLLWQDITGAGSLAPAASQTITVTLRAVGAANPATNLAVVEFAEDANGDPVPPSSSTASLQTHAASLGGHVYDDGGAAGFGAGDVAMANVAVSLYTDPNGDGDPADGVLVAVTTTQADGSYEFLNLGLGSFVVVETDPLGYKSIADTQGGNDNRIAVVLSSFTASTGHDFLDDFIDPADYGNITGQVRDDVDADGDLGDSDSGIPGVTVELYSDPNGDGDLADGVLFASTLTNGSGSYGFNLVPPGSYVVVETDPAGHASTSDKTLPNDNLILVTVAAAQTSSGNDFLDTTNAAALGTVGNLVWSDTNNDGLKDAGESGIDGVIVQLYRSTQTPGVGLPYLSTVTAGGGEYSFANVPAGGYVIYLPAVNFNSGALQGAALSSTVTDTLDNHEDNDDNGSQAGSGLPVSSPVIQMGGGESENTVDFGFVPNSSLGSISGQVLDDQNNDNTGDTPIVGVTLTLKDASGNDIDSNPALPGVQPTTTTTAVNGGYTFSNVPPGSYRVVETDPAGFISVTTNTVTPVVVTPGLSVTGVDFVDERPATLGNLVWHDANNDGLKDAGESGIDGVIVELLDGSGNSIDSDAVAAGMQPTTSTTAGGGLYSFSGVPPGTYRLRIASPPGLYPQSSTTTGTSDDQVDNDDNGIQSTPSGVTLSPYILLAAGEVEETVDFGFTGVTGTLSISGQVRDDFDLDGNFSDNDQPVPGVTLHLYADSNGNGSFDPGIDALVMTTSTNGMGAYLFENLPDGAYFVLEVDPTGATSTGDTHGSNDNLIPVTLAGGSSLGNDFLDAVDPAGYIYDVTTGAIVPGGSVSVSGPGQVTLVMNGGSGQYSFITDGTPGAYTIVFTPPTGYIVDPARPVAGASFDPTGGSNPTVLGSGESASTPGTLTNFSAVANPYYLTFVLEPGDPLVINNNIPLRLQVPRTYEYWKDINGFGPTPGSNGDNDCYTDLVEYALNLNGSSGVQTTPAFRGVRNGLTGRLDVSFNRVAGGLSDVTYTLMGIGSLANSPAGWTALSLTPVVTANGDGTETVTYADVESDPLFTGLTEGFVRLKLDLDQDGNTVTDATASTPAFGWKRRLFDAECVMTGHPFLKDKNFCGTVDAVVGSTLNVATSAGGSSVVAQFAVGRQYYAEVFSGDNTGHRFEIDEAASTATTIALDAASPRNTLPGIPATLTGDKVIIRGHFTLNELFPSTQFVATNSPSTADRLMFYDRASGGFKIYWLYANGGSPYWILSGNATLDNEGGRIMDPAEGWFTHPKNAPQEVVWHGMVRANPFACPLSAGPNFIGSGYPMDQSPAMRGMTTAAGFSGSNDPLHADQLLFWKGYFSNQAMAYFNHFLVSSGALQQWTTLDEASLPNENQVLLFKNTAGCIYKMRNGLPGHVMPLPWNP